MTMITPSYLGETIEYSSLHACRSTLEDPTEDADAEVASALFHRAKNTSDTAAIFWLKNRKSKQWRDRTEIGGADGPIEFVVKSILEDK